MVIPVLHLKEKTQATGLQDVSLLVERRIFPDHPSMVIYLGKPQIHKLVLSDPTVLPHY
jgi:hypothetical protein